MFHTARETWDSCLLATGVNVIAVQEIFVQMLGHKRDENFPFHIKQGDSELADVAGILFFWDERCHYSTTFFVDVVGLPGCSHQLRKVAGVCFL